MKYDHLIGAGFDRWTQGEYTSGQIQAFNDFDSSFILCSGSYRSGKTEILARAVIRHLTVFPNSKFGVFRAHLASLKKSTLPTILQLIHPSWVKSWSNTDLIMRFVNDSQLSFIGADFPDRLGSIELTGAAIDEASEVSEEAMTMIQGRLSGTLTRPPNYDNLPENLKQYVDQTIGHRQIYMACNPKSTSHYLYNIFFKEPKPGHTFYVSNSISNRNLPENYLVQNLSAYIKDGKSIEWVREQIRKIRNKEANADGLHLKPYLTPLGQRNLLGLWVALEGAIYNLDDSRHLLDESPRDWEPTNKHILGIDFGFHNPRIAVIQEFITPKGKGFAVVDYWHDPESTDNELIDALKKFQARYNFELAYFPHDQPGIFRKVRDEFGASLIRKAKTSVLAGIGQVSTLLNQGLLIFLKNPGYEVCWDEFTGYEWAKDKDGAKTDQPVKKDDHYPDGVRYALFTYLYRNVDNLEDYD